MDIDYREIGLRIARRRIELGLRQAQVCEMCDLNDKYLSAIECARSIPSIDVLLRICNALNITPNTLLLGTAQETSSDLQIAIIQKLKGRTPRDLRLISSFIDWLANEE